MFITWWITLKCCCCSVTFWTLIRGFTNIYALGKGNLAVSIVRTHPGSFSYINQGKRAERSGAILSYWMLIALFPLVLCSELLCVSSFPLFAFFLSSKHIIISQCRPDMTFMIWVPNPCRKLHPRMKVPIFIHHQTMVYLLPRRACLYILLKVCCLYLIMFAPLMVAFIPTVTPKIKKDTPRWILKFIYEPAAHCHQLKKNAAGNALTSLDTFDMFYEHLSSWGNEKEGKTATGTAVANHPLSWCSGPINFERESRTLR